MSRLTKKEEEDSFRKKLFELLNINPDSYQDHETPDCIIELRGRKIGIEFTKLLNKKKPDERFHPSQKHELEQKIAKLAESKFLESNETSLNVRFSFQDDFKILGSELESLAEQIAAVVNEEVSKHDLSSSFDIDRDTNLPTPLKSFHGYYVPTVSDSIWYAGKARFVPNPTIKEIEEIVKKKQKKIKNYPTDLEENWLVIAEGITPISWFDSFSKVSETLFPGLFDRVFILRILNNKIIELSLRQSA